MDTVRFFNVTPLTVFDVGSFMNYSETDKGEHIIPFTSISGFCLAEIHQYSFQGCEAGMAKLLDHLTLVQKAPWFETTFRPSQSEIIC